MKINKEQTALNVIENMQTAFGLYEPVIEKDKVVDLKMLWLNKHYLELVGITAEEAQGKMFSEIAPSDVAWIPFYGDVALQKTPAQTVESYSDEINAFINVQAYSPAKGQVATIVQVRSKFVQSEYEKEYEEQKIRNMIKLLPEGIFFGELLYDGLGRPIDVKCIYANQAFEIYEGAIVGSLQGKKFFELYPNYDREELEKCAEAIEKNKRIEYVKIGAGSRTVEVSIYPQGKNQLFIVLRDISATIKIENDYRDIIKDLEKENEELLFAINKAVGE
jgi:PAS domain-containing protein